MSSLDLQDLFVLYRADALDDPERAEAEALLNSADPTALEALAEADAILGQLGTVLEPVTAPPEIEEALLARAEASTHSSVSVSPGAVAARVGLWGGTRRWAGSLALAAGLSLIVTSSLVWLQREAGFREDLARLENSVAKERGRANAMNERVEVLADRVLLAEQQLAESERARLVASVRSQEVALQQKVIDGTARVSDANGGSTSVDVVANPSSAADSVPVPAGTSAADALAERVVALRRELGTKVAEQRASAAQAATEREQLLKSLAESRDVLSLVRAPDVGIVDLVSEDAGSPSSASVFWDAALKNCYLHVQALPQIADSERYALWLRYEDGEVYRVSDFAVDARGNAEFYEDLPRNKGGVLGTFVTREAVASATQPSSDIVLSELILPSGGGQGQDARPRRYRRRAL